MKHILLTNDDGYEARGLLELRAALIKKYGAEKIITIAPLTQKSACSHSLTLHHPLRLKQIEDNFYALDDGTPADCVYIGLSKRFNYDFELVVSGINHGGNVGEDISYSGTCAGAMEGTLQGISSLATSLYYKDNSIEKYGFDLAVELSVNLIEKMLKNPPKLPFRSFLNLNVPAVPKDEFKGLKALKCGNRYYATKIEIRTDPRGREYVWLAEPDHRHMNENNDANDISAVHEGFAALSVIKMDMCDEVATKDLKGWINE